MRAGLVLPLMAISCAAQTPPPLVNLGRLSIARVFGVSADVRNAFDGGSDAWQAGPGDFVIVRFSRPVTVGGIVVGLTLNWPERFTVQLRSATGELFVSTPVEISGPRTIFAPPRALTNVREVMLTAQDRGSQSPSHRNPPSTEASASGLAQKALVRKLAAMEIDRLRRARAAVDRAADAAHKAQAWLELNRQTDRLAEVLGRDQELAPVAKQASAFGVTVEWCEPGASWFALAEGYERYLQILPKGPRADEAWWLRRMRACGDFEGSREEYEEQIQWYSEFLKLFPASSHAAEATRLLNDAQEQFKAAGFKPQ